MSSKLKCEGKGEAETSSSQEAVVVESPLWLAIVAAQTNLESTLAVAALFSSEHDQAFVLSQAAVTAARATLAAVEHARAVGRTNELMVWQRAVSFYLRLPLNHPRYCLPPLPYPDPDIPYGIVFFANRRIMKRCLQAVVRYLDPQSVMKLRMTTKEINREGDRAMYRVWRYLVAVNLSSPFITLPAVGGGEGQMSFTRAVYEVFFANKRQEVLIIAGYDGPFNRQVTKMIVEQDGAIDFEGCTPMLCNRDWCDAIYHQGEVISLCHYSSTGLRGSVERLDTLTQMQTELADELPNDLFDVAAVVLVNKLLAIGGCYQDANSDEVITDIVHELDEHASQAGQGKWRAHEARLNTARCRAAAVACEGKIFVCGGVSVNGEDDPLRSVESFDPATGTWQLEGNMIKKRRSFSLFVHEEELYAVGGDGDDLMVTTIERRNKDTMEWEHVINCGQYRDGCTAALVGSKIFIFGGRGYELTFDFFDLHSKTWASQDVGGAYFGEIESHYSENDEEEEDDENEGADKPVSNHKTLLPRKVYGSKAVLITPLAVKIKKWTDLNVIKLEDRDTARCDERFEATTGKAIAIPNPWDA